MLDAISHERDALLPRAAPLRLPRSRCCSRRCASRGCGPAHAAAIRVWSAACSSGEEPYSRDAAPGRARDGWHLELWRPTSPRRSAERARAAVWPMEKSRDIRSASPEVVHAPGRRRPEGLMKAGPALRARAVRAAQPERRRLARRGLRPRVLPQRGSSTSNAAPGARRRPAPRPARAGWAPVPRPRGEPRRAHRPRARGDSHRQALIPGAGTPEKRPGSSWSTTPPACGRRSRRSWAARGSPSPPANADPIIAMARCAGTPRRHRAPSRCRRRMDGLLHSARSWRRTRSRWSSPRGSPAWHRHRAPRAEGGRGRPRREGRLGV